MASGYRCQIFETFQKQVSKTTAFVPRSVETKLVLQRAVGTRLAVPKAVGMRLDVQRVAFQLPWVPGIVSGMVCLLLLGAVP